MQGNTSWKAMLTDRRHCAILRPSSGSPNGPKNDVNWGDTYKLRLKTRLRHAAKKMHAAKHTEHLCRFNMPGVCRWKSTSNVVCQKSAMRYAELVRSGCHEFPAASGSPTVDRNMQRRKDALQEKLPRRRPFASAGAEQEHPG